jgi:hypothetical protein
VGAQAALVALILVNVMFNVFRGFGITTVVGLLLALALWSPRARRTVPRAAA